MRMSNIKCLFLVTLLSCKSETHRPLRIGVHQRTQLLLCLVTLSLQILNSFAQGHQYFIELAERAKHSPLGGAASHLLLWEDASVIGGCHICIIATLLKLV